MSSGSGIIYNAVINLITNLSVEYIPLSNLATRMSIVAVLVAIINSIYNSQWIANKIESLTRFTGQTHKLFAPRDSHLFQLLTLYIIDNYKNKIMIDKSNYSIVLPTTSSNYTIINDNDFNIVMTLTVTGIEISGKKHSSVSNFVDYINCGKYNIYTNTLDILMDRNEYKHLVNYLINYSNLKLNSDIVSLCKNVLHFDSTGEYYGNEVNIYDEIKGLCVVLNFKTKSTNIVITTYTENTFDMFKQKYMSYTLFKYKTVSVTPECLFYDKLTTYFMCKLSHKFEHVDLQTINSKTISYILNMNYFIVDKFENCNIKICISTYQKNNVNSILDGTQNKTLSAPEYLYKLSFNAKDDVDKYIHRYFKFILDSDIDNGEIVNNYIKVHDYIDGKYDRNTGVWKLSKQLCNFNFNCMALPDNFQNMFINDFEKFLNTKDWYIQHGIKYQRGYFFEGVPGSGKTSIVRSVCVKYSMPLYFINYSKALTVSDLSTQLYQINMLSYDLPHIVLFEDFDRCHMFTEDNPQSYIQLLINWLDGITEVSGRIVIFTANNCDILKKHTALVRNGRIDKIISINYASDNQIKHLFHKFCDYKLTQPIKLKYPQTIVEIINIFKQYYDQPKLIEQALYGNIESTLFDYDNCTYKLNEKNKIHSEPEIIFA